MWHMQIDKKKLKLDALMFWWLGNDGTQINNIASCDAVYICNNQKYGYITEFDKTKEELLKAIKDSISQLDYIYVYTDDSSKKRELIKILPSNIGIFSNGDTFGLGMTIGVVKSAEKL